MFHQCPNLSEIRKKAGKLKVRYKKRPKLFASNVPNKVDDVKGELINMTRAWDKENI